MKLISVLLGIAFLIISGIMLSLLKSGGALKPAGVIKPVAFDSNQEMIGEFVALRLFPEFNDAKNVIWYIDEADPEFLTIPGSVLQNLKKSEKPTLLIVDTKSKDICAEKCWFLLKMGIQIPNFLSQRIRDQNSIEIYVQSFRRDEKVPEECESEKILEPRCIRPISVREIRRKLKTEAPHFYMQRYLGSQFYLFIEKQ